MKKFAPLLLLFLVCLVAWEGMLDHGGMSIDFDDEHFDGPIGALVGLTLAGGGVLVGVVVALFVALVVTLVCAGLGLLLVVGTAGLAFVVLAAVSPVLLPLLIPVAIIWYLLTPSRKSGDKDKLANEKPV